MERAEYHRHSRARMAETAKDASRRPAPDAPERIDHRRRCTRHDHRTCCRGSRGSASLPCHTLRKRVEMCHAGSRRRPILNATTSPLYARRYTRASSPRWSLYARIRSNPRLLCPTNDYFGQQCRTISNSIQVGAWSLAWGRSRTQRSTPACRRRGASSALSSR
jgi:hypothetical protein